jgi:hypothetical protein
LRNAALQTLDPQKRAKVRWLQAVAPKSLAKLDEQRRHMVSVAQALYSSRELKLPRAFEGQVTRGPDGALTSPNSAVAGVLRYVQAMNPEALRDVTIGDACTLSLPLEANVLLKSKLFAQGCAVRQLDLTDGKTSAADINMTTYATREAIKKADHGFGSQARLTHAGTEDDARARALGFPMEGEGEHPFAFLQELPFQVESSSPELQRAVEQCLNSKDPTTLELRGRLGALAVKSVFSQKEIPKEAWVALGLSLAVAGGVAVALDVFAWSAVHDEMMKGRSGMAPTPGSQNHETAVTRFADIMLEAITPLVAETVDAFLVGRLVDKLRGGSFVPQSLADAWDTLKDALISGSIAAGGSVGNNALAPHRAWPVMAGNLATNVIATATSGAMVPIVVAKTHERMGAGVIQHMSNGFFPEPEMAGSQGMSEAQQHRALAQQVKRATDPALTVAPGDGLAITSMGIGALVSAAAFLPIDALVRAGKLKDSARSVITIFTNTPTEVISTTIGLLTGRRLGGLGKAMTTDDEKDSLMAALIADKAVQRLNAPDRDHPDATVEITEAELHAIEHPSLELAQKGGKGITMLMNGAVDLVSNVYRAARGQPQSLGEQVDIAKLKRDV